MSIIFAFMLITFNAFAGSWDELVLNQDYKITQSIALKQNISSGSILEIRKGEKFKLEEISPLGSIGVMMLSLNYKNCPGTQMTTEMEIIPVKNTSPVVEIGAQLTENCTLEIFIENKDLMSASIFE